MKNFKIKFLVFLFNMTFVTLSFAEDLPQQKAIVAGGCFWCVETPYDKLAGVYSAQSGYSGGKIKNPTYKQVVSGATQHIESVQIKYNPLQLHYLDILKIYFLNINPMDSDGQFADRGANYRPAIFYQNQKQKLMSESLIAALNTSKIFPQKIGVEILPFDIFYTAEDYHQNYHKKNPERYKIYKFQSGRQPFLEKVWTKENQKKLEQIVDQLKLEFAKK